jgi:hypothetical protein
MKKIRKNVASVRDGVALPQLFFLYSKIAHQAICFNLCRRNKMVPEVGDSTEKRHLQVI